MSKYENLVNALKALTQGEAPTDEVETLPMAEDEWYRRPETVSYGIVSLDFESNALRGDMTKCDRSWEGSVDLFSLERSGAGWVPLIEDTLTAYADGCWELNSHTYETETGLFHWEWIFEVEN